MMHNTTTAIQTTGQTLLYWTINLGKHQKILMAHTWSIDILAKASLFDGAAAHHKEEIKAK